MKRKYKKEKEKNVAQFESEILQNYMLLHICGSLFNISNIFQGIVNVASYSINIHN